MGVGLQTATEVVDPAAIGITDVGSYIIVEAVTLGYTTILAKDVDLNKELKEKGKLTQLVPRIVTSAQPWQSKDWVLVTTGNWSTSYTVIVLMMPSGGMQEVLVEAV